MFSHLFQVKPFDRILASPVHVFFNGSIRSAPVFCPQWFRSGAAVTIKKAGFGIIFYS